MPQAGDEARTQADFYRNFPLFHSFDRLMDPALYAPLPDGWLIGVADIVESTRAIRQSATRRSTWPVPR